MKIEEKEVWCKKDGKYGNYKVKYVTLDKELFFEKFWEFEPGGTRHCGLHDHAGSPYETDTDCGNCGGGRCCDLSKEELERYWYTDPARFTFGYNSISMREVVKELNLSDYDLSELYEEWYRGCLLPDSGYYIKYPNFDDIKDTEFGQKIQLLDEEGEPWNDEKIKSFPGTSYLNKYYEEHGYSFYDSDEYHHLRNQYYLSNNEVIINSL